MTPSVTRASHNGKKSQSLQCHRGSNLHVLGRESRGTGNSAQEDFQQTRADLLTPNLPEAARLLNQPEADSADQMVTQARALLKMGPKAVLMKGGHSAGNICSDALVTAERVTWLSAPRIDTRNTHGTGCTYAAAIAAGLAHGKPLGAAVQAAHDYLHRAIIAADQLEIGTGHGPVHHFHAVWS